MDEELDREPRDEVGGRIDAVDRDFVMRGGNNNADENSFLTEQSSR